MRTFRSIVYSILMEKEIDGLTYREFLETIRASTYAEIVDPLPDTMVIIERLLDIVMGEDDEPEEFEHVFEKFMPLAGDDPDMIERLYVYSYIANLD